VKIGKKDWIFIAIIAAVLLVFYAITGEEKTKKLPLDGTHQQFNCETCHDGVKIKFPEKHPAKPGGAPMRCLFCHKQQK